MILSMINELNDNQKFKLNIYYVKYNYIDNTISICCIRSANAITLLDKISVYAWKEYDSWEFVTEEDYINYGKEVIDTWKVTKAKPK